MHRVRMFKQTTKSVLTMSCISILILLLALVLWKYDWYDCYIAFMYGWAKVKLSLKAVIPNSYWHIDYYRRDLSLARVDSIQFMNDTYVKRTTAGLLMALKEVLYYSPLIVIASILGSASFFGFFSKRQRSSLSSKEILRGHDLAGPRGNPPEK